jgi:hypothetical protein
MIFPLRSVRFGVGLAAVCLVAIGCSSRGGSINFESTEQNRTLTQAFPHAYISQVQDGECDVILVDNATDWDYSTPKKNRPLEPTPLEPIRQMMHIHLYWRPLAGTTKNPAATNASIDWYVLGPEGTSDVVVYEGAGFVLLHGSGEKWTIVIRDGMVTPKVGRGSLRDPVGQAKINGRVVAKLNDARVRQTMAEVQKQAGVAKR